jgi:predicted outer membrane repeat protein
MGVSEASPLMVLMNCVFSGNTATGNGGGLYTVGLFNGPEPWVTNCTLSGNQAGGDGGGIYSSGDGSGQPAVTVSNCIVYGNSPNGIIDSPGAATTVSYSDVQGGWVGAGSNNTDEDPLFVDADGADDTVGTVDDNLHLLPGSPCIDAGNNGAVADDTSDLDGDGDTGEPAPLDLDGNPRFVDDPYLTDTGCCLAPIVDMGANELCLWDCGGDTDGNAGIVDLLALLAQWNQQGTTCDFDLGEPGVGINEFLDLLANWGPCP